MAEGALHAVPRKRIRSDRLHTHETSPKQTNVVSLNAWRRFFQIATLGPFALNGDPEDDPQRFVLYTSLHNIHSNDRKTFGALRHHAFTGTRDKRTCDALRTLREEAHRVIGRLSPDMRSNLKRTLRCVRRIETPSLVGDLGRETG